MSHEKTWRAWLHKADLDDLAKCLAIAAPQGPLHEPCVEESCSQHARGSVDPHERSAVLLHAQLSWAGHRPRSVAQVVAETAALRSALRDDGNPPGPFELESLGSYRHDVPSQQAAQIRDKFSRTWTVVRMITQSSL